MKCKFLKENSEQCQANSMVNSDYCYLHNPNITKEEKQLIQSQGGKANIIKIDEELPEIEIKSTNDVVKLLEDTVNRVRKGQIDIRIANTLAYIAGHLIKALEITDVGKRLERFERVIYERRD